MAEDITRRLGALRETFNCGSRRWLLCNDAANEIAFLRSQLARAREVMKPFGEMAAHLHPALPDAGLTADGFEVRQIRACAAFLAETQPKDPANGR
jgi:hypothetical protein